MNTFVVNLPSATERREYISRHLAELGIAFELVEGVRGAELSEAELAKVYDRRKSLRRCSGLSKPEIGCTLSHLKIYRRIVGENLGHALILEDDARLSPDVPAIVGALEKKYPAGHAVAVLLTHVPRYLSRGMEPLTVTPPLTVTRSLARIYYGNCGHTHGYFITQAAARRMLEKLFPAWAVADHWIKFENCGVTPVRALVPYAIGLDAMLSEQTSIPERGHVSPHSRKTVARFFRKYINTELPLYLWRRAKFLAWRGWSKKFGAVREQPDNG